jgi:hypothetical protein
MTFLDPGSQLFGKRMIIRRGFIDSILSFVSSIMDLFLKN